MNKKINYKKKKKKKKDSASEAYPPPSSGQLTLYVRQGDRRHQERDAYPHNAKHRRKKKSFPFLCDMNENLKLIISMS